MKGKSWGEGRNCWTSGEDEILRTEWVKNTPVENIASMLNRSKNSIIGRAHRLKMPVHLHSTRNKRFKGKPRKKHQWKARRNTNVTKQRIAKNPVRRKGLPIEVLFPPSVMSPVLPTALGRWQCKFMYGDPQDPKSYFCGAPVDEDRGFGSYCSFHASICYRSETRKKKPRQRRGKYSLHLAGRPKNESPFT